jgi:glycosyltransferase involved in cell wall biosynthesis
MRKQLTVVTPHYSETADMMESMLMSIKHQVGYDLNKIELILVDDCGPTKVAIEDISYMKLPFTVRFEKTTVNAGPGVARQKGIDNAEGEWVVCIDADDIFSPDAFASFQFALDQNQNLKWINFSGKVVGLDNQRAIIQDHRSELVWSFGHFLNTDWLRKKKVKYHPEIRSNEEQVFFQALWARTNPQMEFAHVEYPVYYWDQKSTNTITRYNGGEYSRTCVPEFFKGRNVVLDDLDSLGKKDELIKLAYSSVVHGYYTVHQTIFDEYPEWKKNAEEWIGWILGKYNHLITMLDPRYRLQVLLQGATSCDRQVRTTFEEWCTRIARSSEPEKCLLPREDINKSLNRPHE